MISLTLAFGLAACGGGAEDTTGQASVPVSLPSPSPLPNPNPGKTAIMSWDANSEQDLAGYRVYYGSSPSNYFQARGEGIQISSNSHTVTGLTGGQRYYFAVTAVDIAGNESGYSVEIFKDVP